MDNNGSAGFFRFGNHLNHTAGSLTARRLIFGGRANGIGGSAQSGGSTTLTSALELGTSTTGWGFYQLSSGSLNITGTGGGELGLFAGYGGEGTFDQTSGSVTTAANVPLVIGRNAGSTGNYTINGATATAQFGGSASVGGTGSTGGGTGFLNVMNGAMTVANKLTVWNTGHVNVSGGTLTVGALAGRVTLSGGTLATTATGSLFSLPTIAVAAGGGTLSTVVDTAFYATLGEGAGTLTKTGAGTLSLDGDSSRTGDTRINGGAIFVNRTSSLGSGSNQAISFDGGALRVFEDDSTARPITLGPGGGTIAPRFVQMTSFPFLKFSIDFAVTSPIVGGGGLTKGGGGRLYLTGDNTYTGGTIVNNDFNAPPESGLYIGGGGTTGSIVGNVINNHRVIFIRSDNTAFAGVISGPGTVSQSGYGTGTLVFTGNNTYSGVTSVSLGSLQIGAGGTSGAIASNVVLGAGGKIAFNRSNDTTYVGVISGSGELAKSGSGTLSLTANQTYTGPTTVNAGALAVNGSILGGAEVNSGGTLKGTGTIGGAVTVHAGGILAPGTSAGTMTVGGLVMTPTATLGFEIGGTTPGSGYDQIFSAGSLEFDGTLQVSLINGFAPALGQSFNLFDWGSVTGAFAALTLPSLPAGLAWDTSQLYTTGTLSVISTTGQTFAQWATANGIPGALSGGNHDSDAFDNGIEFALGLFPSQPGTVEPIIELHTYGDGQRLRARFTRPLDRTGVTLVIQASDDLISWIDLATSVDSAPFTGSGFVSENRTHPLTDPGLVEIRDLFTTAAPRRWMRISVTLAP